MNSLMEKLKNINKYDKLIYIMSLVMAIVCIINKEHFTSVICHSSIIMVTGFYGVNRLKSMSSWLTYEISYLVYMIMNNVETSNIITDTSGGIVIALVAVYLSTRNNKDKEKIIKLSNVYNIIILSTFITGVMTYSKLLSDYSNNLVMAVWILAPTYVIISRLAYLNLTYMFNTIYYIVLGITVFQNFIINGGYIEILEYSLMVMSLIMSYVYYKTSNKRNKTT